MSDVHEVGLVTKLIKAVKTNIRDLVVAKLAAAEMRMEKQIETFKDGKFCNLVRAKQSTEFNLNFQRTTTIYMIFRRVLTSL